MLNLCDNVPWVIMAALPDNAHIETYFTDLRDTHVSGVGVKETSYYPYLSNLLNFIGKKLKPKVRCIIHPRSIGAGLPDGALITADQKSKADDPLADGLIPSRGVLEIKAPDEDVEAVVGSDQVAKYLSKYGLVVVTNLRQFVIVARVQGQPTQLEAFTIAPSEKAFWKLIGNPRKLTEAIGESFNEYLTRVLLQAAPLTAPKEVAWFLASYARDAKARIESQGGSAGPGNAAYRAGGGARPQIHGQGRRAFLPLLTGADVVLWRVLRLGAVVQASDHRAKGQVQLARGGMVAARADDQNAFRAARHADEASIARAGGSAQLDADGAQPRRAARVLFQFRGASRGAVFL